MLVINGDALSEYTIEVTHLKEEDNLLAAEETSIVKRRDVIKERIKDIALKVGEPRERVLIPAGSFGAWDRQVTIKDEGLSLEKLQAELGVSRYRELVCVEIPSFQASQEKLEAARLRGDISEAMLVRCSVEGTPQYSLKRLSPEQARKAIERDSG